MPRSLIVIAILLVSAIYLDRDIESQLSIVGIESEIYDDASEAESVLASVTYGSNLGFTTTGYPAKTFGADPVVQGAVIAGADAQADDERSTPAHIPSSTSIALAPEEIDREPVLLSPYALTSAIQTELTRLGCYSAEVDGLWGSGSRAAVESFNSKTQDAFQLDPSEELLSELRDAPDALCERSCLGEPGSADNCAPQQSVTANLDPLELLDVQQQEARPSYLPPWMTGKEDANSQPDADLYSGDGALDSPRYVQRPAASRTYRRASGTTNQRARRRSKAEWLPKGWPGS